MSRINDSHSFRKHRWKRAKIMSFRSPSRFILQLIPKCFVTVADLESVKSNDQKLIKEVSTEIGINFLNIGEME